MTLQLHQGLLTFDFPLMVQVKDCSVQTANLVGDAALGEIVVEVSKDHGIHELFVHGAVASWFEMTDDRPLCQALEYRLWHIDPNDEPDVPMVVSDNSVWDTLLDLANYQNNGDLMVDTTLEMPFEEYSFRFRVEAFGPMVP